MTNKRKTQKPVWRKCEECRKRLFSSKRSAREGTQTVGNAIRVYRCPHHDGFHVTDRGV